MGESKRLSDGSYIDADYVYDATRGMTQGTFNQRALFDETKNGRVKVYSFASLSGTSTQLKLTAPTGSNASLSGLIISRYGLYALAIECTTGNAIKTAKIVELNSINSGGALTMAYTDNICTVTVPAWVYGTLICIPVQNWTITST